MCSTHRSRSRMCATSSPRQPRPPMSTASTMAAFCSSRWRVRGRHLDQPPRRAQAGDAGRRHGQRRLEGEVRRYHQERHLHRRRHRRRHRRGGAIVAPPLPRASGTQGTSSTPPRYARDNSGLPIWSTWFDFSRTMCLRRSRDDRLHRTRMHRYKKHLYQGRAPWRRRGKILLGLDRHGCDGNYTARGGAGPAR